MRSAFLISCGSPWSRHCVRYTYSGIPSHTDCSRFSCCSETMRVRINHLSSTPRVAELSTWCQVARRSHSYRASMRQSRAKSETVMEIMIPCIIYQRDRDGNVSKLFKAMLVTGGSRGLAMVRTNTSHASWRCRISQ